MSVYQRVGMSITGKSTYVESDDSDYEPPEKIKIYRKKKHAEGRRKRKQLVRSRNSATAVVDNLLGTVGRASHDDSPWERMPAEILFKIFGYIVASEGSALPCLQNLRAVCKHWCSVANISHLWTHVSFTPKQIPYSKKFKAECNGKDICLSDQFQYTHTYHFARLGKIAPKIMDAVSDKSERIEDLNVVNCTVGAALLSLVQRHGRNLRKVSVKECKFTQNLKFTDWRKYICEFGENLKSMEFINRDRNQRICGRSLDHLKNLTELKMQNISIFDIISIKHLAMLKVLHLKDTRIQPGDAQEFDHPKLEDVDLSLESSISYHGHDWLVEMLCNCHELRRLSLRGRYVSIDALCSSLKLCNRIVHLDVSVSDSGLSQNSIGSLLYTIGPSLKELHIDKCIGLEESLQIGDQYRSAWKMLRTVSMQDTNICGSTLLSYLIDSFYEMRILNISSCRWLPRGCKRLWSRSDMKSLKTILMKSLETGYPVYSRRHILE